MSQRNSNYSFSFMQIHFNLLSNLFFFPLQWIISSFYFRSRTEVTSYHVPEQSWNVGCVVAQSERLAGLSVSSLALLLCFEPHLFCLLVRLHSLELSEWKCVTARKCSGVVILEIMWSCRITLSGTLCMSLSVTFRSFVHELIQN